MNETQTVFALFFAIFFGAIENTISRFKPFHLPLFFDCKPARQRACLSFIFLNILPLAFFSFILYVMRGPKLNDLNVKWSFLTYAPIIFLGAIPALAMFGFSRLWLGIVESRPHWFYAKDQDDLLKKCKCQSIDPTLDTLGITQTPRFNMNILWAFIYIIVALIAALLYYCCIKSITR